MHILRNRNVTRWTIPFLLLLSPVGLHAEVAVAVVAGAKSSAASLTKDQVADIFLGRGGAAMVPTDQPESNPLREEFYSKVVGKSAAQAKAHWSKLAFTGKGTPPKEGQNSAEIKKMLAGDPQLVGYIEKSAVDGNVKVLFSLP